jgi:serine/threonine protein phosphatase PrpC
LTDPCRFLLCTDGLTDMLAIDQMEEFVSTSGNATLAVANLFSAAMKAGGQDNTTIIIADIQQAVC